MARRSAPSDVRRVNERYTPQSGGVYLQFAHDRSWRVCVTVPARTKSSTCSWGVQCDGAIWTPSSNLYQNGWPGYAYGGRNTVTITTSYYPRIGGLSLFLTYYQNGSTSTPPTRIRWLLHECKSLLTHTRTLCEQRSAPSRSFRTRSRDASHIARSS